MKDTTTTIDEILKVADPKIVYLGGDKSRPPRVSIDALALLKWHQDKARSYVLEVIESYEYVLSSSDDADNYDRVDLLDVLQDIQDNNYKQRAKLDQTLKAIETLANKGGES